MARVLRAGASVTRRASLRAYFSRSSCDATTPQAQEDPVHAITVTGEAKPHLLVREQAEKQRLAALQSKDQWELSRNLRPSAILGSRCA